MSSSVQNVFPVEKDNLSQSRVSDVRSLADLVVRQRESLDGNAAPFTQTPKPKVTSSRRAIEPASPPKRVSDLKRNGFLRNSGGRGSAGKNNRGSAGKSDRGSAGKNMNRNDDANNSTLSVLTGGVTLSAITAAALATRPERKNPFGQPAPRESTAKESNAEKQKPALKSCKQSYSSFAESVIAQNKNVRNNISSSEAVIARNKNYANRSNQNQNGSQNRNGDGKVGNSSNLSNSNSNSSNSNSSKSNYNHQAKLDRIAAKYSRRATSPEKRSSRKPKLSPSKQMESKKRVFTAKQRRGCLQDYLKDEVKNQIKEAVVETAVAADVATSPKESLNKWKPENHNDDACGSPAKVSPKKLRPASRIPSDSEQQESNDCGADSNRHRDSELVPVAALDEVTMPGENQNESNAAVNTSTSEEPPLENLLQQASKLLKKAGKVGLERRRRSLGRLSLGERVRKGNGAGSYSGARKVQRGKDEDGNVTVEGRESNADPTLENGTGVETVQAAVESESGERKEENESQSVSQTANEPSPQEEAGSALDATWTDAKLRIWSDVRKW